MPHSTSIGAIADFLVDALARPLAAAPLTATESNSSGQRILGLYGPSLSGKSTALRAAFGQLIREAAQHDRDGGAQTPPHASGSGALNAAATASSAATFANASVRASASALPLAGVEGAVTGSLLRAAGGLAATEKVRLVYLPVGDNFKVARHVTQIMADMLGYRPLYFMLINRLPLAWRFGAAEQNSPFAAVLIPASNLCHQCNRVFAPTCRFIVIDSDSTCSRHPDSPAADVAAMFSALEQASLELRREQNVRVFVCVENLHRIVCSRHMLLLNDTGACIS